MSFQRQRSFGVSLLAVGLLIVLMGMGGSWGAAYGQSITGPTPTVGVVSPETGAEGPPTGRRTIVAGESGVADTAGEQGVGSGIDNTGADSAFQWPLLATGIVFFAVGATIFLRTRKAR
jgi:hypothetical protein